MKFILGRLFKTTSTACVCVFALQSVASAETPSFDFDSSKLSGLEILVDGHPGIDRVFEDGHFFDRINPCRNWAQLRPQLDRLIEQKLPELNPKLPKGVSVHHQRSQLSNNCTAFFILSGRTIVLKISVPRNVLFFKTTTPTVFGSYGDPSFSLDYDLSVAVTVDIPSTTAQGLKIGPVNVSMTNVHRDSQNLVGDLIQFADTVWQFLGGSDFLAPLTQSRSFDFDGFKSSISQINDRLASLRGRNLPVLKFDYDGSHRKLTLRLTNPATANPDTCSMGYVWREAVANDHVCVTPRERDAARRQNAEASRHKQANSDRCLPGYVWREATPADHVCVTPAERQQARVQNSEARTHREASRDPVLH